MVNKRNLCTADLNDGVGLITCMRTVLPNDEKVLVFVDSVELGSHREIAEGEMDCVDDLEKVQRSVVDRVQTTTSANET